MRSRTKEKIDGGRGGETRSRTKGKMVRRRGTKGKMKRWERGRRKGRGRVEASMKCGEE